MTIEIYAATGGMLGVALGSAADEVNRQQHQARLNRADARADEMLGIQKDAAARQAVMQGIQINREEQDAADRQAARDVFNRWRAERQKVADGKGADVMKEKLAAFNANQGAFADGTQLIPDQNGQALNHVDQSGKLLGTIPLTPQNQLSLLDRYYEAELKFSNPAMYQRAVAAYSAAAEKAAERASKEKIAAGHDTTSRDVAAGNNATSVKVAGIHEGGANARNVADLDIKRQRFELDKERGGLTLTQERSNAEIDAAREAVGGLSPQEIQRRTAKATNTGRDNPDYDPAFARQAMLAGRRKVGADDWFDDSRQNQQPVPQKLTPKQAAQAALESDPAMAGYTLGEQTMRGFKVLDKTGKHVGYYGPDR